MVYRVTLIMLWDVDILYSYSIVIEDRYMFDEKWYMFVCIVFLK